MTTDFTKEFIAEQRKSLIERENFYCWDNSMSLDALDHIEHLQQRIAELEANNKDFHLACINALDLHRESDVPKLKDIPNIIEEIRERNQKLEIQLKSKDIIINNQQGRLNYYATKDLLGGKNEKL